MSEWHQLNSSITMPEQQESTKKKTLKSSSRSFWFSTGLLSLFDTTTFETSNTFSYLSETASSDLSFSNPFPTSLPSKVTPRREDLPMRVLILNAQSIKSPGKPVQLQTLIQSTNADVVIRSESWLNPDKGSSEVFPPDFTCYRNDRSRGKSGGVFLLVSSQFDSYEPEELKAGDGCELVCAKLKFQGSKDLYIGSFYRPPDNKDPECLDHLQKFISRVPTQNGAHLWIRAILT